MAMLLRRFIILLFAFAAAGAAWADARNLAPGFGIVPKGSRLVVMQPDIELFELSAGGVQEPKADWTEAALHHTQAALRNKTVALGLQLREISDDEADELAEINTLHAAVARSISLHHMWGGNFALPTKGGRLDWSLGDAVAPIRTLTGADYALFVWMRDSYASAERKVTMVAMALLGVGLVGGMQVGYASLVDLQSGRVLWFNQLLRGNGDLREAGPAAETIGALLANFPKTR
ncbi:hypothetical protein [Azospira restricta]|uniref:Uncharacterized protein n=1 Tax=Azospira restricta TaxID=404405 RepID=A0A974PW33_9RHOO|nr:hypothetical protein [Azospira restricta]QRJ62269.1 hypothetical protein IWH25_10715 [Azospira restricta]